MSFLPSSYNIIIIVIVIMISLSLTSALPSSNMWILNLSVVSQV